MLGSLVSTNRWLLYFFCQHNMFLFLNKPANFKRWNWFSWCFFSSVLRFNPLFFSMFHHVWTSLQGPQTPFWPRSMTVTRRERAPLALLYSTGSVPAGMYELEAIQRSLKGLLYKPLSELVGVVEMFDDFCWFWLNLVGTSWDSKLGQKLTRHPHEACHSALPFGGTKVSSLSWRPAKLRLVLTPRGSVWLRASHQHPPTELR